MCVTRPAHHILAESIILLPREEYRTEGFSLCSILPSVISIHLASHIVLSTQFSSILHLHVWRSTPLRSNAVQCGIHVPIFPRNLLPPEMGLTMQLKRVRWLPDFKFQTTTTTMLVCGRPSPKIDKWSRTNRKLGYCDPVSLLDTENRKNRWARQ
jgi:hypothetical protein